jgi:phosphoribosylglycinamide formyltransferase-1
MLKTTNIGVLVSGSGSNLQAIIDGIEAGELAARICVVLSNRADAFALERAKKHGIPSAVVSHRNFTTREAFDARLAQVLAAHGTELVVMAGFMRVLSPVLFAAFPERILNIHPALLPAFPGVHVQQQAIAYGARFSGCTVHFADPGVDTGPIIIQAVVPIFPDDTADSLAARILKEEHKIYPQAIRWYSEGRLRIEGRIVRLLPRREGGPETAALHNPPLEPSESAHV